MSTLSITDPDFRKLLEEALSDGHHASAGISTTSLETATEVIEVAEDVAVERLEGEEPEVARRLAVARGLAALLYESEQKLLAKVDELRSALQKVASAPNLDVIESIARAAQSALDNDDTGAAEDAAAQGGS